MILACGMGDFIWRQVKASVRYKLRAVCSSQVAAYAKLVDTFGHGAFSQLDMSPADQSFGLAGGRCQLGAPVVGGNVVAASCTKAAEQTDRQTERERERCRRLFGWTLIEHDRFAGPNGRRRLVGRGWGQELARVGGRSGECTLRSKIKVYKRGCA